MALCKYRDVFGKPRQGFHAARVPILDLALWDVVGTLLIAAVVWRTTACRAVSAVAGVFVLATCLHLLFCVKTPTTGLLRHLLHTVLLQDKDVKAL